MMSEFLYKGKKYEISPEAEELADLLRKEWKWSEYPVAVTIGLRQGHSQPEITQALGIMNHLGWPLHKIAKAVALPEALLTKFIIEREANAQKLYAAQEKLSSQELVLADLALYFGLRPSELAMLKWKDVDLKKDTLFISGKNSRLIYIGRYKSAVIPRA